ncbi:uncharacterized protein K02A2.6-like [Temnothorax curvispinosus]|uniref:Uncharacterized protein K02A2.6-like n=1 Tax=Temnothorax curvispinosus TaxID=300111 RepID=A0A6J1R3L8_9HYME|nr:uncharacterized protein K02A2.6-like [Temnothorax curvispinosus]
MCRCHQEGTIYLGPETYNLLCDKLAPVEPTTKTYEELVAIMKNHFNPEPLEIAENFRFLQRRQGEGETAQEYMAALQKPALHCKFGDYLRTALRNQFVFGLRSERIQGRLLECRDLTVDKAVEIAVGMEVSARDAAQLQKSNAASVNSVNTNKKQSKVKFPNKNRKTQVDTKENKSQSNNKTCYRCGSDKHLANNCDKKEVICNYCQVKGHLKKVCMKAKKDGNQTNQIEVICLADTEHATFREKFMVNVEVNKVNIQFEVDSGAAVSLIGKEQFVKFFKDVQIHSTTLRLVTYCGTELEMLGVSNVSVCYKGITNNLEMYVVKGKRKPLLGREWIRQLNVDLGEIAQVDTDDVQALLKKYSRIFQDNIGKITGIQAKLKLREGTTPVFAKSRKIAHALLPKVKEEIDKLVKEGVLRKVQHSDWATPIVPFLVVDQHPLPTTDEMFSSLNGGTEFSKLDLREAYLQLEVSEDSRKCLVLNTPFGLYESCRLMYGVASAPAVWQREIENLLQGIEGVGVFLDDIRITAPNRKVHLQGLRRY